MSQILIATTITLFLQHFCGFLWKMPKCTMNIFLSNKFDSILPKPYALEDCHLFIGHFWPMFQDNWQTRFRTCISAICRINNEQYLIFFKSFKL